MERKVVSLIILTLFLTGTLSLAFNIQKVNASLPVHNIDTGLDYATIQEAINANETLDGHTLMVDAGVYYENVVLNKTLSLIGENRDYTVIDANGTGNGVVIQADHCVVENFTIQNCGFGVAVMGNSANRYVGNVVVSNIFKNNGDAVGLSKSDRNIIANNTFKSNGFNIIVGWINPFGWVDMTSNNNTITGNNMTLGVAGIQILYSKHNIISENSISNMTDKGIAFLSETGYPNIPIITNNSLCNNVIVNCTFALFMSGQDSYYGDERKGAGSCNNVSGNVIQHSELGLYIYDKGNNTIVGNTIADNVFGMYLGSGNNLLRDNEMNNNVYNFVNIEEGPRAARPIPNDVDTSNTVNGKSICYLFNQANLNINPSAYPDMGFLALKNCSNIIIENMTFSNNGFGISLDECANVTIEKTTIQDNFFAISAASSVNIKIRSNTVQNNLHGISLIAVDPYSEISNNLIVNNTLRNLLKIVPPYFVQAMPASMKFLFEYSLVSFSGGIYIHGMSNSTVMDNVISNNERGIYLEISIYNVFRNNTMTDNVYNFGKNLLLFPLEWVFNPPDPPQISPFLMNDVDTSNTVDGKPVYWWINRHDEQVPKDAGYVVLVNCTNMVMKDLVLQNNTQGALLVGVSDSLIFNNTIKNAEIGICISPHLYVNPSTNNTITRNDITRSGVGIRAFSPFSTVSNNILMSNLAGICISDNLTVTDNTILHNVNPPLNEWVFGWPLHAYGWGVYWVYYGNGVGIVLEGTNTTVQGNLIQGNYYGIGLYPYDWGGHKIYHNNFINNTEHVFRPEPIRNNTWDNGYPSGGNYWSNYNGTDLYSGPYQNMTGSDGIGDTAYTIDANNTDRSPLMAPINILEAGVWNETAYTVDIVSNSTVSDFHFNPDEGPFLKFNVTGENGTVGFCRVTIPNDLLWIENGQWNVFVDDQPVNYTIIPDENYTYLCFTYNHTTKTVLIQGTSVIPEFPSSILLIEFLTLTTISLIFAEKKRYKKAKT